MTEHLALRQEGKTMLEKLNRLAQVIFVPVIAFPLYFACWWLALIDNSGLALVAGLVTVSHGGMSLMRWMERGAGYTMRSLFSPSTQSWAFMYGYLFLAWSAMWEVRLVFGELTTADWGGGLLGSVWWFPGSFAIGVAIGITFHLLDGRQYRDLRRAKALKSATKLWHDLAVCPVLFGLLIYYGLPVVVSGSPALTMVGLGVGGWLMLSVADWWFKRLAHPRQHPLKLAPWITP